MLWVAAAAAGSATCRLRHASPPAAACLFVLVSSNCCLLLPGLSCTCHPTARPAAASCAAELLTQASRAAMAEMVHHIFSRLDVIPEPVDSPFAAPAAAALSSRRLQVSPVASRAENASTEEGEGGQPAEAEGPQAGESGSRAALAALQDGAAAPGEAAGAAAAAAMSDPAAVAAAGEAVAAAEGAAVGAAVASAALDAGLSAEAAVDAAAAAAAQAAADAAAVLDPTAPQEPPPASPTVVSLLAPLAVPASGGPPSELGGYGVDAVREVLLFIISLVGSGVHTWCCGRFGWHFG